jgi:DNA-binding NarL/FixJ family response regulator
VTAAPRVLIADDHPAVRSMVGRALERGGFTVCVEESDAEAAVNAALRKRPDICLIGLRLPGGGIRATGRITTELPETPVVVLSDSERRDQFLDAIRAGATGYLLQSMDRDRLPDILRSVLAGEAAIPGTLVASLARELQTHGRRRAIVGKRGPVDLSAREWEVLTLMCDGVGTAEIAARLFVSPVTVRRHRSRILAKLGARDRDEAMALVEGQV